MRGLFRAVVALGTLGLALIGCARSAPSGGTEEGPKEGVGAASEVAFYVPGMS
jgi:hypothetical protein